MAGAEAEAAEHQHTASDNEGSDGEAAHEGEHRPAGLARLMSGPSDTAAAAAAQAAAPMMIDDWGAEMVGAAAAAAAADTAAARAAPFPGQLPAAAAGGTDGGADDALLVSPGNTTPCWTEVVGAGFASADPAWQAARMDLQLQQQLAGPDSLDHAAAAAQAAASTRVERIYSSKRSWVTQQIATPAVRSRATTPGDSAVTLTSEQEQQQRPQRTASGLPGAAGPAGSEGCGFPGLFSAPTACLAAAGGAGPGGVSAACEMHTSLHLCDSNRLAAGRQGGSDWQQHEAAVTGSKRKSSPGSIQQGPLEPSSAAGQAVPRSDKLVMSSTAALTCPAAAAPQAAAAQAAHQAAVPDQGAAGGAELAQQGAAQRQPQDGQELEGVQKRQKLEEGVAGVALNAAAADAGVHPQATFAALDATQGAVSELLAAGHAGRLAPIRLAPAPIDRAAAAAQMPPPAAHTRPHAATPAVAGNASSETKLAAAAGGAALQVPAPAAAVSVPASAAPTWDITAAGAPGASAGPASLLPQQAQQQQLWRLANGAHQLPPVLGAAGLVGGPLPSAGMGLPLPLLLQGLPGLPGIPAQQQQQLGLAGLWPAAPPAMRPWGVAPAVAAALAARPLAPAQAVGALPGGGLLPSFAAGLPGLHAHHPLVAALNGARAVLFGGPGGEAVPGGGGAGNAGGGRRHQGEGSEQADSCLP